MGENQDTKPCFFNELLLKSANVSSPRLHRHVIWNIIPYETPGIPTKAGIPSVDSAFRRVCGVDSRFRGNDCAMEHPCLASDTTYPAVLNLTIFHQFCYR
jgi:hypothetical protein